MILGYLAVLAFLSPARQSESLAQSENAFQKHNILMLSSIPSETKTSPVLYAPYSLDQSNMAKKIGYKIERFPEFIFIYDPGIMDLEGLDFRITLARKLVTRIENGLIAVDSSVLSNGELNEMRSVFSEFFKNSKWPANEKFKVQIAPVVYISVNVNGKQERISIEKESNFGSLSKIAMDESPPIEEPKVSGFLKENHGLKSLYWQIHNGCNGVTKVKSNWIIQASQFLSKNVEEKEDELLSLTDDINRKLIESSGLLPKNGNQRGLSFSDLSPYVRSRLSSELKHRIGSELGADPDAFLNNLKYSIEGNIPLMYISTKSENGLSVKVAPFNIRP